MLSLGDPIAMGPLGQADWELGLPTRMFVGFHIPQHPMESALSLIAHAN